MNIRKPTICLLLVAMCGAPLVAASDKDKRSDDKLSTSYYLPKSVLTVSGTIVSKNTIELDAGNPVLKRQSETTQVGVVLSTVADSQADRLTVNATESLLAKNSIEIGLTPSGTLASLNGTSEGQLGSIVKNIFGAFVSLAKITGGLPYTATNLAEALYAKEHPIEAQRRTDLKDAMQKALDTLVTTEKEVVAVTDPVKRKALRERIVDLRKSVDELRAEMKVADTHFTAWKSTTEDRQERRFEYVVDVDILPNDDVIQKELVLPTDARSEETLQRAAGRFGAIAKDTRVLITQTNIPRAGDTRTMDPKATVMSYRIPRPTVISVYMLDGKNRAVLVKQSPESVVGSLSAMADVSLPDSKWTTKKVTAVFTGAALTKISAEGGSALASASETLRGLPAEYLSALKQANEIAGEQRKSTVDALQGRIDALKKEKELNDAKIAAGESLELGQIQADTARLNAEIQRLEAQRTLAGSQAFGDERSTLTLQQQILKLQNDLTQSEIQRLELQAQLEKLQREPGRQP